MLPNTRIPYLDLLVFRAIWGFEKLEIVILHHDDSHMMLLLGRCLVVPFLFLWLKSFLSFFFLFVIVIFVLHLQAFVFFIFKLLQFFVTSASQFVRFFLSLWICKIDCVFFCFFASRFLYFICEVFGFCEVLCVVEYYDLCKSCWLITIMAFSNSQCTFLLLFFCFKGLLFRLSIFYC